VVKSGDWPQKWDAQTGENIVWKIPVSAAGNSSPVLWGDRLFLTGAAADLQKVLCFSRVDGKLLWQTVIAPPRPQVQPDEIIVQEDKPAEGLPATTYAAPTPATDGERVYATYASADIAAVDFAGRIVWQRNLGKPESSYGRATSLLVHQGMVIVQFDRGDSPEAGLSAMLALNAKTGNTLWSTPRPVRQSWCTPVLATVAGHVQLIAGGSPLLIAYDPDDGKELWRCDGMGSDVAASPTFANGLVYFTNENAKVFAIRPGAGDVTNTNVVWTGDQGMSDAASPACDGRVFLQANSRGRITCYDAKDGRLLWDKDLGCTIWASPTIAGNLAYIVAEDGKVYVFDLVKEESRLVATCNLGEMLYATPAFADGRIYFRGRKNLFCVGAPERKP
jgi:outer membrane protein assembly factor BamB